MSRPTIALAMIVKNEAENLPRLLASVAGCFDEIHITDTGSTDQTVEIAKAHGCQVHSFEWCDDFAAARNASFAPVKTDFVMWLDADDVLENREAFLHFRDNVMGLADYWLASYHYASDAEGKPVCTFIRERVLRTDFGFSWRYFVHEGVTPNSAKGPARAQFVPGWAVKHMRTEADLKKDHGRNLRLFEKHKDRLDGRMRYYYGKELFEANQLIPAINELSKAVSEPALEPHDRILAMQYLVYAYMGCNQFEQAIQMAQQGTILAPHRAEFYTAIGDCYLKQGRLTDALPSFAAAKGCISQGQAGTVSPIFTSEDLYTYYPRNQMARIYAQMGDLERAAKEAQEAADKFKHPESQAIAAEIVRIQSANVSFKDAKPCEDIVITTAPQNAYEWDAEIAKTQAMGGSETAAIEMAYWLRRHSGRRVIVFNMRKTSKTCDGVEYRSTEEIPAYMEKNRPFLHIAWRHNFKITDAPTFVWSHDLVTPGAERHQDYERILALTPFHKRYLMAMQGIPEHKIWVTRNGIKPERFADAASFTKDPWKFVFSSSPDRGLDRTMRVLDRVRVKYPEVKLHVFYGIEHLAKWGHADLQKKLASMMEERKEWVIYHGATQQDELMRHFKEAAYCVQPSDFIETSMISARERLYCGVFQIIRAVGGVVDTLADAAASGMATLVESDCITEAEHDRYAEEVCKAIEEQAYLRVKADPAEWSWESVSKEWLETLPALAQDVKEAAS